MYSISFWGSSRVLGTSMKDERSLMPGSDEDLSWVAFGIGIGVGCVSCVACGGGGGGGNGEFEFEDGMKADFFCACIRSL